MYNFNIAIFNGNLAENGDGLVKKRPFSSIITIKFSLNTYHIYYN